MLALFVQPVMADSEPSTLLKLFAKLTPQRNIDDATWSELSIAQRFLRYDYKLETYVIIFATVYFLYQSLARHKNKKLAQNFVKQIKPALATEFAQVGVDETHLVMKDSDSRYTLYASGRDNVEGLVARIRLADRYNFVPFVSSFINPRLGSVDGLGDHVDITVKPLIQSKIMPGIFSVINKEYIEECQDTCFFFKLTKLSESKLLPSHVFAIMQEHGEQADKLMTPELVKALSLPETERILRFLAVSDVGVQQPKTLEELDPEPVFTLAMTIPTTSAESNAAALLIKSLLGWIDLLTESAPYNNSALKRIAANRDEERAKIIKLLEQEKEREIDQKKAEQKREAVRKELALSEKEQRALQKREKGKQSRKQRQKMTRKA